MSVCTSYLPTMPFTGDELVCTKFHPNIFNSSRCHDCLRLKHLHEDTPAHTPEQMQVGTEGSSSAPPMREEKTNNKEDSDEVSVVSSCCDARGGCMCVLSPGGKIYLCHRDDEQSSDSDSKSSTTTDEDLVDLHHSRMARLGNLPHRPNPRVWMQSRDSYNRPSSPSHVSAKVSGERDSGYFSLGRAAGSRTFCDKSSSQPQRYSERGHPLPNNRTPEPKATIPFRNPDLGVPSQRRTSEIQNPELDLELEQGSFCLDPVDLSIEVEAQVGPRSPSPTPFKQAESLAQRGARTSFSSFYSLSRNFSSSQKGSVHSSSPGQGSTSSQRAEPVSPLSSQRFGSREGLKSDVFEQKPRSPSQSSYSRQADSSGLQRNFRAFASSVGAISSSARSSFSGLRHGFHHTESSSRHGLHHTESSSRRGLHHTESSSGRGLHHTETSSGRGLHHTESSRRRGSMQSSSPPRWSRDTPDHSLLQKSSSSPNNHRSESRSPSPSRQGYEKRSQSFLQKDDGRRSASPIRKGYGGTSQSETNQKSNGWSHQRTSSSPGRRGFEFASQSPHRSETSSTTHSHNRDSRNSSPTRRCYDTHSQSVLLKNETSRSSYSHRLDNRSPSPSKRGYDISSQSHLHKCETRSSESGRDSPLKTWQEPAGQNILQKTLSTSTAKTSRAETSYVRKLGHSSGQSDSRHTTGSWHGSTYSLNSLPFSHSSSQSRKNSENKAIGYSRQPAHVAWETIWNSSNSRRIQEAHSPTADSRRSSHLSRSHSPPTRSHTSSQSSMESSEVGHVSAGARGLNREEYAMMADLPKVKPLLQRVEPSHLVELDSRKKDEPSLYKPASHSHSREVYGTWEEQVDQRPPGRSPSPHTQKDSSPALEFRASLNQHTAPAHNQGNRSSVLVSCTVEQADDEDVQKPDLLHFKKGWMSKLDESGEWKKHWFVLTDAGLKYYRDSGAEEREELDGEVDLRSCVKVSEFDVDRNYGFQIQTGDGVITLSAMTAGIRRNWIEVLRKSIRPISSPDLTQLPDNSTDKVNSRYTSSRLRNSQSETLSAANTSHRRFDYVELSPVATPPSSASPNQREAGEGQVRELGQGQEERRRDDSWDALLLRKGRGHTSEQKRIEEEIERKWAEFERLPLKEMRSLPVVGLQSVPLANEALQREVASLRQQLESMRGDGGVGGCVCVGREAGWSMCLEHLERVHKEALEELQRQHVRQTTELERERERELEEETRATVCAMEALKKAHQEQLEREVQRAKSLTTHTQDTHSLRDQQQVEEVVCLRRELQALSVQFTQKCVELRRMEQSSGERQRELDLQERELDQLRRDNQDLHTRLAEGIQRMHSCVTSQGSEDVATVNAKVRTACELEVLLRVKNTEVNYLQKEITCLRDEVHFLNGEKQSVCERYTKVCEELKVMKERGEQELHTLRQHLRLAMAALQEGQHLGNSLQH